MLDYWGLSNLTFILVAWILYCLLPKLDGPGCYCLLTRRSLPLVLPSKCPIWVWLRNNPPQFLNELKCRTLPCLWTTLSDQVGGDHKKSTISYLKPFFTICKILFPLIDDIICERPLTAPPPTQPTKSAQRKQKRGAAQHLLWVHIVPLLSCFLPLEMTSHNKTHNNQFILF